MLNLAPASPPPAADPQPFVGPSIHVLGDIHVGKNTPFTDHANQAFGDLQRMAAPDLFVQIGDQSHNNIASQIADAKAKLDALPYPVKRLVAGNHDLEWGTPITGAQWAANYGYNDPLWTRDVGPVTAIGITQELPDNTKGLTGLPDYITLTQHDLDWLDATLTAATKPCWIFNHAPLFTDDNTIGFWVAPDASVRSVLGKHTNAAAWFSGHTHWDLRVPSTFTLIPCGTRQVANVNVSAPVGVNHASPTELSDANDPIYSVRLKPGSHGEVNAYVRDHKLGCWSPWPGTRLFPRTIVAT